jgi:hypothetical protein
MDLLFVGAYLVSTLPAVVEWTFHHRLASLDLNAEANLPTNYTVLKLYVASLACVLMVFWHRGSATIPVFWKVAAVVLFLIGLDESAQLHELWAAGLAPKIFGNALHGNQYTIVPYLLVLGVFYVASLRLFPRESKAALVFFVCSGLLLIFSQALEWGFSPAVTVMHGFLNGCNGATGPFDLPTLELAWEEGLEMLGYTCLVSGCVWGMRDIQNKALSSAQ